VIPGASSQGRPSRISGGDPRTAIHERLNQIRDPFKLGRYRRTPTGDIRSMNRPQAGKWVRRPARAPT
jgi:hypothetical protein